MSMNDDAQPMPEPGADPLVHDAAPAGDPNERIAPMDPPSDSGEGDSGEAEGGAIVLTPEEARVLGALMEKAQTTPDHYPLTMNALVAACNQKSNREPIVQFDDQQVEEALAGLGRKRMAARILMAGSRVPKFKHTLELGMPALNKCGTALLTPLLLRGQQTLAELRTRTERMYHFTDLDAAATALDELADYPGQKLVRQLPAGGGRRVPTYVHLLSGEVDCGPVAALSASPAPVSGTAAAGWREELEAEVAGLREEVSTLRKELDEFRSQFG